MEEKIRELSALAMGILVLMVAAVVFQFFDVRAWNEAEPERAQEQTEAEPEPEPQPDGDMLSGMNLLDNDVSGEEQEILEHQMQMELPAGVSQEQIQVENDVLHRRVTINIPRIAQDYYFEHPLRGSSTHIDDLQLGSENGGGVIEITLDRVYEVEAKVEDSWLYLDFIPPRDCYEKVIVVDAGHGGSEPGAVKQDIYEKNLNLGIVLELKKILDEHPEWKVYYTRTEDVHVSLNDRVQLANLSDANLFISVHNNSTRTGEMSDFSGTEVMYDEEKNGEPLGTERFATILLEETVAACGSRNLGLFQGHSIYIIRTCQVPVALLEAGFMTSYTELNQLNSSEYQQKVAQGIYQGIRRAFEEGF